MRDQVPNAAPALATAGIGPRVAVIPVAVTYKEDERNTPAANIELVGPACDTWRMPENTAIQWGFPCEVFVPK